MANRCDYKGSLKMKITNEVLSESQYPIQAHNILECLLLVLISYIQYKKRLAWHDGNDNVSGDRGYVSIAESVNCTKGSDIN